jgi:hypothetical protein
VPELSDEELAKMPPAVREGYRKARKADTGEGDNPYDFLIDMMDNIGDKAAERKANLDNIIKKAKGKKRERD